MSEGIDYSDYSGGVPERMLKLRIKCPNCGHVFVEELPESWYTMNMTIYCPKCGGSFNVKDHSTIIG